MSITIGGPTAQAWLDSGNFYNIGVTLIALPANEASITYVDQSGPSSVFDATDRDGLINGDVLFGIGVNNTLIKNGDPGVTSIPSEIGYYGNPGLQGLLGDDRADALCVQLDKDVFGGTAKVSFFYGAEQAGEELEYQLWNDGELVHSKVVKAEGNGAFSASNPGFFEFDLEKNVSFDEIKFVGYDSDVLDASDFLVEEFTTRIDTSFEVEKAISNIVIYADCDGEITKFKFDNFDEVDCDAEGELGYGEPDELYALSLSQLYAALDEEGFGDCEILGVTIKAGNNGGNFGPGEGDFFDVVEGDDLVTGTTAKADYEFEAADYADIWC